MELSSTQHLLEVERALTASLRRQASNVASQLVRAAVKRKKDDTSRVRMEQRQAARFKNETEEVQLQLAQAKQEAAREKRRRKENIR